MPTAPAVTLDCPAKVNLALSIGSPLPNGYHPLASWMVALDFTDQLELRPAPSSAPNPSSHFEILFAPDAPVPARVDWPLEKDLAFRAHALLQSHAARPLPIHASLRKRIPTGAGLGGGSSDAAAMLVGLNQLFNLAFDAPTLCALGQKLGSDVAFLVAAILAPPGSPSALVTGLGETLQPLPLRSTIHLVLIFPPFGCPTAEVYRAFDHIHANEPQTSPDIARARALAARDSIPPDSPFNDLAQPACHVRPQLGQIRDQLTTALNQPIHITGSGSTLFILAPHATAAQDLARRAHEITNLPTIATQSRGG